MIDHHEGSSAETKKVVYADGSIAQIVVWKLPTTSPERPHGYKYRLNYCAADGTIRVRYDNEKGKGDHKHIDETELPYNFESLEKLFQDFANDVNRERRKP